MIPSVEPKLLLTYRAHKGTNKSGKSDYVSTIQMPPLYKGEKQITNYTTLDSCEPHTHTHTDRAKLLDFKYEILVNWLSERERDPEAHDCLPPGTVCVCVSSCCFRFHFTPPLLPIHDLWPQLNPAVSCPGLHGTIYLMDLIRRLDVAPPLGLAANLSQGPRKTAVGRSLTEIRSLFLLDKCSQKHTILLPH